MLARLVAGELPSAVDSRSRLFIDRDPTHFRLVLNYLRDGDCSLPTTEAALSELLSEAEFYSLDGLRELVCPSVTAWRPGYALALRAALARSLAPGGGRAALGDALRTLLVCAFGPGGAAAAAGVGFNNGNNNLNGSSPPFSPFSASVSSPFSNSGSSSGMLDASCFRIPGSRATVEAAARDVASHDGGMLLWTRRRLPPNAAAAAAAAFASGSNGINGNGINGNGNAARLPPMGLPAIGNNRGSSLYARTGSVEGGGNGGGDLFAGTGTVRASVDGSGSNGNNNGVIRGVRVRPASETGASSHFASSSSSSSSSAAPSVLLYTHLIQEAHIHGDAGSCEFEVTHELAHFVGPDPNLGSNSSSSSSSQIVRSGSGGLGLGSLSLLESNNSETVMATRLGAFSSSSSSQVGIGGGGGMGLGAAATAAAASVLPTFAARLFRSGASVHPVDGDGENNGTAAPSSSSSSPPEDSGGGLGLFQPRNGWSSAATSTSASASASASAAEQRNSSSAAAASISVPNNTRNNSSSNLLLSTSPTAVPSASAHCARGYALRDGTVAPSIVPVVRSLTEALPRHQRCLRAAVLELARDPRGAEAALAAAGFSSATVRVESAAWPCDAFAATAAAAAAAASGEGNWNGGGFYGNGNRNNSNLNDGGPAPAEDTFPSLPLTDVRVTVELVL